MKRIKREKCCICDAPADVHHSWSDDFKTFESSYFCFDHEAQPGHAYTCKALLHAVSMSDLEQVLREQRR